MESNERRSFIEKTNPAELFWSRISDSLCDGEILLHVVHTYVNSYRSIIEDHTLTAKSIDEKKPWKSIKESAEKDGFSEFAEAVAFIDGILIG